MRGNCTCNTEIPLALNRAFLGLVHKLEAGVSGRDLVGEGRQADLRCANTRAHSLKARHDQQLA